MPLIKAPAARETVSGFSENDRSPITELLNLSTSITGAKLKSTKQDLISVAISQPTSLINLIADSFDLESISPNFCIDGSRTKSV